MPINELDLLQFPELRERLRAAQEFPEDEKQQPWLNQEPYKGKILPLTYDPNQNAWKFTPAEMFASPVRTVKDNALMAAGKMPLKLNSLTDLAGNMAGLSIGGRYNPNVLNSLGSVRSETANTTALAKAQIMQKAGASQKEIIQATGWWKDPDKNWVYEIPNTGAIYKYNPGASKVSDVYTDSNLFAAYPDLANTPFKYAPNIAADADFNSLTKEIRMHRSNESIPEYGAGLLQHEGQHWISDRENLARGYGPRLTPDDVKTELHSNHAKSIDAYDDILGNKKLIDRLVDETGISSPQDPNAWQMYKAGDIAEYVKNNPTKIREIMQKLEDEGHLRDSPVNEKWLNQLYKNPERAITTLDANVRTAHKNLDKTRKRLEKSQAHDDSEWRNYTHALGEINAEVSRFRAVYTPEQLAKETFPETRLNYIKDHSLDRNKIGNMTGWGENRRAPVPEASMKPVDHDPFVQSTVPSDVRLTPVSTDPKSMMQNYKNVTEQVPISWLEKFPGNKLDDFKKEELAKKLGPTDDLKEPLLLTVGKDSGTAKLGEGNHRLARLKELGYTHVPVRVIIGKEWGKELPNSTRTDLLPKAGEYFKGDAAPSEVFKDAPVHKEQPKMIPVEHDPFISGQIAENNITQLPPIPQHSIDKIKDWYNRGGSPYSTPTEVLRGIKLTDLQLEQLAKNPSYKESIDRFNERISRAPEENKLRRTETRDAFLTGLWLQKNVLLPAHEKAVAELREVLKVRDNLDHFTANRRAGDMMDSLHKTRGGTSLAEAMGGLKDLARRIRDKNLQEQMAEQQKTGVVDFSLAKKMKNADVKMLPVDHDPFK